MGDLPIQKRKGLMDGFVLDAKGAYVGDAIRTTDICIPSYRQAIEKAGGVILTQFAANDTARTHDPKAPTLETCRMVVRELERRTPEALAEFQVIYEDAAQELKGRDLPRGERSFWQKRERAIQKRIDDLRKQRITAEELYNFFQEEDIALHMQAVPDDLKEALGAVGRASTYQPLAIPDTEEAMREAVKEQEAVAAE